MHGTGELHAGSVASYRWGSLLVSIAGEAAADGRVAVELLASASSGVIGWSQPRQLRAALSILHELVHLEQDVSTGLGAFDHLATREAYLRVLATVRYLVTEHDAGPYPDLIADRLRQSSGALRRDYRRSVAAIETKTVALRQLTGGSWLSAGVRDALRRWEKLSIPPSLGREYSLRLILEGEAACIVHQYVRESRASASVTAELERYADRWNVLHLPEEYQSTLFRTIDAVTNGEATPASVQQGFDIFLGLTRWIADIVQSLPPPRVLASAGEDAPMFDPVARFIVLQRALNRMSPGDFEALVVALLNQRDPGTAEGILLESVAYRYPTSLDIYRAWEGLLDIEASGSGPDASLFAVRRDAIRYRLARPGEAKGLAPLAWGDTPLQMLVGGVGIRGLVGNKHIDQATWSSYAEALIGRNAELELYDLFVGGRPYRCPYARGQLCAGRLDRCASGIASMSELPDSGRCVVRRGLASVGFVI